MLQGWTIERSAFNITLKRFKPPWNCPQTTVIVDAGFSFTILKFDWLLPEDHSIYKKHKRSLRNINVVDMVSEVDSYYFCEGVPPTSNGGIIHHCVPVNINECNDGHENDEAV